MQNLCNELEKQHYFCHFYKDIHFWKHMHDLINIVQLFSDSTDLIFRHIFFHMNKISV